MIKNFDKIFWLIPITLVWVVYWQALNNGLVYDDIYLFKEKLPQLKHISDAWSYYSILGNKSFYYRPILFITLVLIRNMSGYHPWGYHLILLILHMLNTVLVYGLSLKFLRGRDAAKLGALAAATLFAVHPIHVEVVAWIAAIAEALLTFFFLFAFLFFILFRSNPKRKLWLVLSLLCFLLALFSKETAVTFLGIVLLYDILIIKPSIQKRNDIKLSYIAYLIVFFFYLVIRSMNISDRPFMFISPGEAVLKFVISLGYYFHTIIWPSSVNPYIINMPSSTTFVIGSFFLLIMFLIACTYSYKKDRLLFFHILFFIVTLLPGALVALSDASRTSLADRYLYLPSYGFCFLFGWFMTFRLADARSLRLRSGQVGRNIIQSVKIFIWIVILLVSGIVSHDRVKIWRDNLSFWKRADQMNPQEVGPLMGIGKYYLMQGDYPKACDSFNKVLALKKPMSPESFVFIYVNKGLCLYYMGHLDQAEANYKKAIQISPHHKAYFNLGLLYSKKAKTVPQQQEPYYHKAIKAYQTALKLNRSNPKYAYYLAMTYETIGKLDQAKRYYKLSLDSAEQGKWQQKSRNALERFKP